MRYFYSFTELCDQSSSLYQLNPPARLALLGSPVAHSRSPEIHNERIKTLHLPWCYVAIDVKPEELADAFEILKKNHFIGFNLTMPHKQAALSLLDEITHHARLLEAINTVTLRDGKFYGSNTDGPGFVQALQEEWNFSLRDRSLLILGATGGAGRALAIQSALEGCRQLFLSSRTPEILQQQVEQLLQIRPDLLIKAIGLDEPSLHHAMPQVDLIVNATPAGFLNTNESSLISSTFFQPRHYVYDIVYSNQPTPLMQAASAAGAQTADGTSMLRLQGALCFETWLEKNKFRDS